MANPPVPSQIQVPFKVNRLPAVESIAILVLFCAASSVLYIHKTLIQEILFFAIIHPSSIILPSFHILNRLTSSITQSLDPFQLLTEFS